MVGGPAETSRGVGDGVDDLDWVEVDAEGKKRLEVDAGGDEYGEKRSGVFSQRYNFR